MELRTRARRLRLTAAISLVTGLAVPFWHTGASAAPAVTTGGPFTYVEQDPPTDIGTGTSLSGSNFYDGKYIDFEITGAVATEHLGLEPSTAASVADGVVSVVGSAVYIGDGTTAVPIGSIDATHDGREGRKLRVTFGSDFRNAGFETGDMAPWTPVNQFVELGVTSIAGFVTQDTATYPTDAGGDGDVPASATYDTFVTSADPPGPTEGTYALGLTSSMTTLNTCDVVHGPAAYSGAFDAVAGQTLTFDWRAYAGSDAYAVFGYLLNTATGAQTEVLDQYTTNTNGTTNWATVNVTVPSNGTYRFVFVSGTYDASCGKAAGASLYVDNFQVVSASFVDDAMVSKVAALLTYENTSDDPAPERTVAVSAENSLGETAGGAITVDITPVNDPPVGTPATVLVENTPADDVFADVTGTLAFTDVDDTALTYGIDGGVAGSYTVGVDTYDHQATGSYGTLYVDSTTGAYRIVPDDAAIEAVAVPSSDMFTVTASDGSDTGSTLLTFGVTLPPVPRAVTGAPGDGQVTVSWDPPTDTTGVMGYTVTAAPGGASCTTANAATTSCTVTGLTNGTAYTFTVGALYEGLTGSPSLPSSPVVPVGPPTAPLAITGTPGDGRVLVEWDPPANDGGSAITAYEVVTTPGDGGCATTGATNCTVLGLAVGTAYTFTVIATNALGTGPASEPFSITLRHATTTSVVPSASTIDVGDEVTLTATVTGASPTGSVEFFDGATSLGSAALSGGSASVATSSLPTGDRSITAVYSGDVGNQGSTSPAASVTVRTVASVAVSASDTATAAGDEVTLTATVTGASPTGSVEFFDGATSLGSAVVSGGSASVATSSLPSGVRSITAVYSGDGLNTPATSTGTSLTVKTIAAVALVVSEPSSLVGDEVTLTATVTGASPTGSVEFFDGATSLGSTVLDAGTATLVVADFAAASHSLTAVYPGDALNTDATSATVAADVSKTAASVAVSAATTAPLVGDPVRIVATVTGRSPSGSVEFFDGATSLGVVAVTSGTATLVVPTFAAGSHSITAVYQGDAANTAATSAPVVVSSTKTTPEVTVVAADLDVVVGSPIVVTITVTGRTPTGTVELRDGDVKIATATLRNGTATITVPEPGVGSHRLVAIYPGDGANGGLTSGALTVSVGKHPTSVALRLAGSGPLASATRFVEGAPLTLEATLAGGATPTGTIEFLDTEGRTIQKLLESLVSASSIGSAKLDGRVATIDVAGWTAGTYDVIARYSGDALHAGSVSAPMSIEIVPAPTIPEPEPAVRGAAIPVTGSGYQPNTTVTIRLGGADGAVVGTVTTDATGSFTTTVTLDETVVGQHSLYVEGEDATGAPAAETVPVEIIGTLPTTGGSPSGLVGIATALLLMGLVLVGHGRASARRSARRA